MKKIDFVNGTTIDGASTFNQIQDNVEEVFNGAESMGSIVVEDIECKNKFDTSNLDTRTVNGITTSFGNARIILNGTTNGAGDFYSRTKMFTLPAGKYTTSVDIESGGYTRNDKDIAMYLRKSDNAQIGDTLYYTTATPRKITMTFTLTEETDIYIQMFNNGSGFVASNLVLQVQLEKGSTATKFTEFKKYGYNSQESMGKIVVDDYIKNNIYNDGTLEIGKAWYGSTNSRRARWYIPINAGDTYSIKLKNFTNMNGVVIIEASSLTDTSGLVYNVSFSDKFTMQHKTVANTKYLIIAFETTQTTMTQAIMDALDIEINLGQNENKIYSTEEIIVGTWINGETLYRKTYKIPVSEDTSSIETDTL